jgi:phosphoribosyl-ATP pyrophosphohydrolase
MSNPDILDQLERVIAQRHTTPSATSYTSQLFAEGRPRIAQKVGEEAVETVIAALSGPRQRQIAELADLFYHTLVLMRDLDIPLDAVRDELRARHRPD